MRKANQGKAWLYLLPAVLLLLFFAVIPFIKILCLSFMENYSIGTNTYDGIGFSNFVELFKNNDFLKAVGTSLIAIAISIPVSLFIAFSIAIAINNIKILNKVFRTLFFLPFITNALVLGYVTMIIFVDNSVSVSLFNWFLGLFGANPVDLAGDVYMYKMILYVSYIVWRILPFEIIILISALKSIKKEYYVAAMIDGCSSVKQFNKITMPMLMPMLSFLAFSGAITVLKDFDNAIGLFGGESLTESNLMTLTGFMYSGISSNTGVASVVALIISVIFIVIFTSLLALTSRKRKEA